MEGGGSSVGGAAIPGPAVVRVVLAVLSGESLLGGALQLH